MTDDTRLDARVRGALTGLPAPDESATRDALASVLDRDSGRSGSRAGDPRSWFVPAMTAAAVAAVVTVGALVLGPIEPEQQPAPPAPTSVVGSWERRVAGADLARWDGAWRMTLSSDGATASSDAGGAEPA